MPAPAARLSARVIDGVVASTAATPDDPVTVRLPSFDGGRGSFGPCVWTPRGAAYPREGDACKVVMRATGEAVALLWFSGDPALTTAPPAGGPASAPSAAGGTAGQAIGGHRLLTTDSAGRFVYPASAADLLHGPLSLSTAAADAGAPVTVVTDGFVTEPSWSWPVPRTLYAAPNGQLTATPASCFGVLAPVAQTAGPDRILFRPTTPTTLL